MCELSVRLAVVYLTISIILLHLEYFLMGLWFASMAIWLCGSFKLENIGGKLWDWVSSAFDTINREN